MAVIHALLKIINNILKYFRLVLIKRSQYELFSAERGLYPELIKIYIKNDLNEKAGVSGIVFSMDRPIQLHALLSSYLEKAKDPVPLYIYYRTSGNIFKKAYDEVFSFFKNIKLIIPVLQTEKSYFKKGLISIMKNIRSKNILFLVDDDLFINDVSLADISRFDARSFVPTLRMGKNITFCYTKQCSSKPPIFLKNIIRDKDKLCWKWNSGRFDWAYPLSVDGHIFLREEIILLAEKIDFNSPNSFEGRMQIFASYFAGRYGVCYRRSRIINIPLNRVQNEVLNLSADISPKFLLEKWNNSLQIDYKKLYGYKNESPHEEVEISFIKRAGKINKVT